MMLYKLSDNHELEIPMRITARLDEKGENYLHKIQKVKNFRSITSALKYALKHTADSLSDKNVEGQKMKSFLESDFIGTFDDPENLSTNYKSILNATLQDKHDLM